MEPDEAVCLLGSYCSRNSCYKYARGNYDHAVSIDVYLIRLTEVARLWVPSGMCSLPIKFHIAQGNNSLAIITYRLPVPKFDGFQSAGPAGEVLPEELEYLGKEEWMRSDLYRPSPSPTSVGVDRGRFVLGMKLPPSFCIKREIYQVHCHAE